MKPSLNISGLQPDRNGQPFFRDHFGVNFKMRHTPSTPKYSQFLQNIWQIILQVAIVIIIIIIIIIILLLLLMLILILIPSVLIILVIPSHSPMTPKNHKSSHIFL